MNQRIIKFRAWEKVMPEDPEKNPQFSGAMHYIKSKDTFLTYCFDNPEYEVTQFTGLLDKNGKEIYEGDLFPSAKGYWEVRQGAWQFWDRRTLVRMY